MPTKPCWGWDSTWKSGQGDAAEALWRAAETLDPEGVEQAVGGH